MLLLLLLLLLLLKLMPPLSLLLLLLHCCLLALEWLLLLQLLWLLLRLLLLTMMQNAAAAMLLVATLVDSVPAAIQQGLLHVALVAPTLVEQNGAPVAVHLGELRRGRRRVHGLRKILRIHQCIARDHPRCLCRGPERGVHNCLRHGKKKAREPFGFYY